MKTNPISYSRQTIDNKDIQAVIKVLKSPFLTQGPKVKQFEDKLSNFTNSKYTLCVNSGTAALHAACFAIDLKPGDEVVTSPLSFVATANCILYMGAKPVFADINSSGLLDPNEVKKRITKNTKAIITVDYAGQPSLLKELGEICQRNKLYLIEDAAHSLGTTYLNKPIGSIADLTCFSFHPVKSITTGEGGAVTTNNKKFYKKMLMFRSHGIVKKTDINPWYYEMLELGFNYRITDFQAALGYSQLSKLNKFIKLRTSIAEIYNKALKIFEDKEIVTLPIPSKNSKSSWHLYPLLINFNKIKNSKKDLFKLFLKADIKLQVHYIPIHLQPYYRKKFGYKIRDYPNSEEFYSQEISLPIYPTLTTIDIKKIISALKKFLQ